MKKANPIAVKSFNINHTSYDKLRPSFSPRLVDQFLLDLNLGEKRADGESSFYTNKQILELAVGTGKFTKNLVGNGWGDNLTVVDASEGMLQTFKLNYPDIKAEVGSSYHIPLEDSSADAIIIAQAFHWFADADSLKELSRVLKPKGYLGLIWNFDTPSISQRLHEPIPNVSLLFEDPESEIAKEAASVSIKSSQDLEGIVNKFFNLHPWSNDVSNYIYTFDTNVPQYRHGKWKELLCNENQYFSSIQHENFFFYTNQLPLDDVYKYWETRSFITCLSEEKKKEIKEHISEICARSVQDSDKVMKGQDEVLTRCIANHAVTLQVKK